MLECCVCGQKNNEFLSRQKADRWDLMECGRCHFQFWWPMQPEVNFINPPKLVFDNSICEVLEDRHFYCLNFLKNQEIRNKKLLDIGCRGGAFLKKIEQLDIEPWGIDLEKEIIALAQSHHQLLNLYAVDLHQFVDQPNKPMFDFVTVFEVLEHIGNPEKFLQAIKSLLKSDGYLVLSAPNFNRLGGYPAVNIAPNHWTRWTLPIMSEFLEKNGFVIKQLQSVESSPRQLFDLVSLLLPEQHNTNVSPGTVNITYQRKSLLRRLSKFCLQPLLSTINFMGHGHTIFVVAQLNNK